MEMYQRNTKECLISMDGMWRDWRAKVKKNHYSSHATDGERLVDCPDTVPQPQWAALVKWFGDEEAQMKSEQNTLNRNKLEDGNKCGRIGYQQIVEELKAEGKPHYPAAVYIWTREDKHGEPKDAACAPILKVTKEKLGALTGEDNTLEGRERAFVDTFGADTHGCVRSMGGGLCALLASVTGSSFEKFTPTSHVPDVRTTNLALITRHTPSNPAAAFNHQQPATSEDHASSSFGVLSSRDNRQVGVSDAVELLSIKKPIIVVARGRVKSTNPTKVYGKSLGLEYVEVYIEEVVKSQMELIRPFEKANHLKDVQGKSIAWPASSVRRCNGKEL